MRENRLENAEETACRKHTDIDRLKGTNGTGPFRFGKL